MALQNYKIWYYIFYFIPRILGRQYVPEKNGICWFLLKVRCECIRIDLHPEPVCHSCPDNLKACEKKNCKSSCTYHHKTYRCCDCPPPACFPSAANVYLKNGKCVQMVELEIGDHVQSGIIVLRMWHFQIVFQSTLELELEWASIAIFCKRKKNLI